MTLAIHIDGPAGAPPLVFLHAIATSAALWRPQVEQLSQRFRVVRVDLPGPGRMPTVEPLAIGQYRWLAWDEALSVASDLDLLAERLDGLPSGTVLDLTLSGAIDLAGERRLDQALSVVQGRCRSLQVHRTDLRLEPTDEDMAALRADGYVGEVLAQLRQRQDAAADDADTAREALAILAGLLSHDAGEAP